MVRYYQFDGFVLAKALGIGELSQLLEKLLVKHLNGQVTNQAIARAFILSSKNSCHNCFAIYKGVDCSPSSVLGILEIPLYPLRSI